MLLKTENMHGKDWMCVLRIIGVLDFVHRPEFQKLETQANRNWACFGPQVKVGRCLFHWVP
jgi:hypothetical protein